MLPSGTWTWREDRRHVLSLEIEGARLELRYEEHSRDTNGVFARGDCLPAGDGRHLFEVREIGRTGARRGSKAETVNILGLALQRGDRIPFDLRESASGVTITFFDAREQPVLRRELQAEN